MFVRETATTLNEPDNKTGTSKKIRTEIVHQIFNKFGGFNLKYRSLIVLFVCINLF